MPPWNAAPAPTGDPYLDWATATGFDGHAGAPTGSARIPVLIDPGSTDPALLAAGGLAQFPGLYAGDPPTGLRTAFVERAQVGTLQAQVAGLELSLPVQSGSVDTLPPAPTPNLAGRTVIAVIDRGCALLHACFRHAWTGAGSRSTRIWRVWDQGRAAAGAPWRVPAGVGYGRELGCVDINALIARAALGESEASLYHEIDWLVDAQGRMPAFSHGSFVLDCAGGLAGTGQVSPGGLWAAKPDVPDAASAADLIFVSTPELADADRTGAGSSSYLLDALRYVLDRAAGAHQVVVNFSIGAQAGPHDGQALFDRAVRQLLDAHPELAITVAAGNGRGQRWNASGTVPAAAQGPCTLAWRTHANDTTDSFVELWFDAPGVELQLESPAGELSGWVAAGSACELRAGSGPVLARLAALGSTALGDGPMALLSLKPSIGAARGSAAAGRWIVRLRTAPGAPAVGFDAWVQRDEPHVGRPAVIQSYFEQSEPPGLIDAGSSLSDMAGLQHPSQVVVGAYRVVGPAESPYSADGPVGGSAPRRTRRVDVLAPADIERGSFGVDAAAPQSGRRIRESGTSVAAPLAARAIANAAQPGALPPGPGSLVARWLASLPPFKPGDTRPRLPKP